MDKFVKIVKTSNPQATDKDNQDTQGKKRGSFKYNPYGVSKSREKAFEAYKERKRKEKILEPFAVKPQKGREREAQRKALTEHLLNTLKEPTNPITHNDIGSRAYHVSSCVTGHQVADGGGRARQYMQSRTSKLTDQLKAKGTESNVLSGVRVYINGFLAGTTDMEMKRTVQLAGGRILNTPSGASHILTSQGLNLSKVHKHFHGKPRSTVHVVKPEWVSDSIQAGKKLSEWDYQILKDSTRQDVSAMLGQASTH